MSLRSILRRSSFLFLLAIAGCSAETGEEAEEGSAAASAQENPLYDAVVRDGTKVTTDRTRSATQSASTHLVGFLRGADADRVVEKLLTVQRWTEVRDVDGD